LNDNILLLPFLHDFNAVLKETDSMIRYTTTDGDSISVKEALYAGKSVIATNVVDRPHDVILINNNIDDLKKAVTSFCPDNNNNLVENGFLGLLSVYKNALTIV
jgi:hypothetical protein